MSRDESTSARVVVRDEGSEDHADIHEVTRLAFIGQPYSDGDEPELIDRLRAEGALKLSLVPLSVIPSRQGQGIGSRLIELGLGRIKAMGAMGCILIGNPDYYSRFGFVLAPEHCPENEPREYCMLKLLQSEKPEGRFSFHQPFYS
tara:strand:- start:260 stop:697 length:438 start_codon:yes stop_codon:yes gene_type:complete